MPVSILVQTVRQVLKTPPNYSGGSSGNVEVSILKFFYFYLKKCSPKQVFQSWSNLSALLKDCLVLAPPAIFLAVAILSQFVNRMQQIVDEKASKDEIHNLCYAINGYKGIHSLEYVKEVDRRLNDAVKKATNGKGVVNNEIAKQKIIEAP